MIFNIYIDKFSEGFMYLSSVTLKREVYINREYSNYVFERIHRKIYVYSLSSKATIPIWRSNIMKYETIDVSKKEDTVTVSLNRP